MALLPGLNIATSVAPKRKAAPKKKKRVAPAALPAAFRPISSQQRPLQQQRKAAAKKVVKAQRAIPSRPAPHVPYILNPTVKQQRAAGKAILKAADHHVLTKPGLKPVDAGDPAQVALAKAAQHYGRASHRDYLAGLGRKAAAQAGRAKLPRAQAIAVGSQVVAAKVMRDGSVHARPKVEHKVGIPGLPGATINLAPLEKDAAGFIDKHTSLNQGGASTIVKNLLGDVGALGEGVFVGGLQTAQAAQRAILHWDLKPTENLGKQVLSAAGKDPIVQAVGATLGVKGASYKTALESLKAHPGFALLDADAGVGIAGRGVGAVARGLGSTVEAGGVRGALAKLGDTRRSPVALTNEAALAEKGYVKDRRYSKNVVHKAVQQAVDGRREPIRREDGSVVTNDVRGREMPVLAPKGSGRRVTVGERELSKDEGRKLQEQRADYLASKGQSVETQQRHVADRELSDATRETVRLPRGHEVAGLPKVKGLAGRVITQAVATGTVRTAATLKDDLLNRAAQIEHELKTPANYPTRRQRNAAKAQADLFRRAASDPRVLGQAEKIVEVGLAHAKNLNAGDVEKTARVLQDPAQAHRSRLSEYALAHMNARYVDKAEHTTLERDALAHERQLRAAADAAPAGSDKARLTAEAAAAREHRIAISGRDPVGVKAHETAKQQHGAALAAHADAQDAVQAATRAKQRLVDRQRVARARDGLRGAHEHEQAALAHASRTLELAEAQLKNAGHEVGGAAENLRLTPKPEINGALRHRDASYLSNHEIEEHARAIGRDPETLAYLPHVEGGIGNRAFHKPLRPGTRPTTPDQVRTGVLYRRGGNAVGTELIREQLTHQKTGIAKAEQLDKQIREATLVHPEFKALTAKAAAGEPLTRQERRIVASGGRFTAREGLEMAQNLSAEGHDFVAIREFSSGLSKTMQEAIKNLHAPATEMQTAHLDLLRDRLIDKPDANNARNVVLIPAHEYNRMIEHLTPADGLVKGVQMLNGPFRMAVLPQPRWLTGNFLEPYVVRLPLSGAGINLVGAAADIHATNKLLKSLEKSGNPADAAHAREIRAQLGGLFVGRRGAAVRRTYEDLAPGAGRRAFYVAHVIRNAPVAKQLADLVLTVPKTFFAVNRIIEEGAQRQALGKSIRADIHEFSGSWLKTVKITDDVLEQVKQGSLKTPTLQRWMKEQHDLLGKYEGFSPRTRKAIQSFMPFLPWSLASARFVFLTMPLHHTAATAYLLKASQVNQDQWADAHKGVPPGELKAANVTRKGGLVDIARYTPWGFSIPLVEGDTRGITDTFLPQLSGTLAASRGQDPFGRDLQVKPSASNPRGKPSKGQQDAIAGYSMLEAMVPLLAIGRRLREGGGTAYADSTILKPKTKPGSSHMSAVRRTLDPFRPTYLKNPIVQGHAAPAASTGSSSGGGGDSIWGGGSEPAAPDEEPTRQGSIWGP